MVTKYSMINTTLLKLRVLNEFLTETQNQRQILWQELIDNATDPVVKMRRFRMLANLSSFESSVIQKIQAFQTTDPTDLFDSQPLIQELLAVIDRSA